MTKTSLKPTSAGAFKRLQFMTDFKNAMGLTNTDLANLVEPKVSQPSVGHWFEVDDMKLSQAVDIIESQGYVLKISLFRPGDSLEDVRMDIDDIAVKTDGAYKLKRLSFLTVALKKYGITKIEMAEAMGLNYTSARFWFAQDDITFSRIFQIAQTQGFSIDIRMESRQEPKATDGKCRCTSSIVLKRDNEI